MFKIMCYYNNENYIEKLYNNFLDDFKNIKKLKNVEIYLLISNDTIYGIFSYIPSNYSINILLFKVNTYIQDNYIEEFIEIIFTDIIYEFRHIYFNHDSIMPTDRIYDKLVNYNLINNFRKDNIKHYQYNYFNCFGCTF